MKYRCCPPPQISHTCVSWNVILSRSPESRSSSSFSRLFGTSPQLALRPSPTQLRGRYSTSLSKHSVQLSIMAVNLTFICQHTISVYARLSISLYWSLLYTTSDLRLEVAWSLKRRINDNTANSNNQHSSSKDFLQELSLFYFLICNIF